MTWVIVFKYIGAMDKLERNCYYFHLMTDCRLKLSAIGGLYHILVSSGSIVRFGDYLMGAKYLADLKMTMNLESNSHVVDVKVWAIELKEHR
jgi:hypothetical protein